MQDTLIEMEIDISKMPLGKIKREQLLKGMKALSEIQTLIADKKLPARERQTRCEGPSNKFYTFVPTSFGPEGPTARHAPLLPHLLVHNYITGPAVISIHTGT